ncbi:extracellular solute-binding protein [Parasedimentitalea psychrophila]|uniref:Extracellular solute-binding protein n=1 Tax=Parasedimentitalea psychrophila TaxID=2997337 RepID=A0A9Y2P3Z1_9RHOB|nr:extracellular solute-binding protein [Parasedimentitalea psychrophila]WIY24764.1 extracellular solute-binding protein [Parasedimentitalea psychrophila]
MKNILMSGMAALLASTTLVSADITILAWPGGDPEKAMRAVVESYNETQGVEDGSQASLIYFSRQGFKEKMLADAAAGSTEFDLMVTSTYDIGRYAPFMSPIDEIIDEEIYKVFPENAIETQKFNGKVYGIPNDLSLHFLYYRDDFIDQLMTDPEWIAKYEQITEERMGKKMSPKAPGEWTWDDYIATSLYFTKSINSDSPTRYGTVLQMKNLLFNMMIWQSTVASNGGDWRDGDGKVTISTDAFRRGLDIFKIITDNKATPGASSSYEYGDANAAFGSGQVAFMVQWNAAVSELNDPEQNPAVAGKFSLAKQPAGAQGSKTHFHSLGLGVSAASENKADALKFLRWLGTNTEANTMYAKLGGSPPVVDSIMAAVAEDRPDMPLMGEHAAKYGFVMNGGASDQALRIYEVMAENFTGYWAGQMSEDEAIANVEAAIQSAFDG